MTHAEIKREVMLAIEDGLETYNAASLAADLNSHALIDEEVDEELAAALLDAIQQEKDYVAEQATREFERELDLSPMTSSDGKPVAADGGRVLFSSTTYDTISIGAMFINGVTLGAQLQSGEIGTYGIVAAVAATMIMAGWFGRNYDIELEVSDEA